MVAPGCALVKPSRTACGSAASEIFSCFSFSCPLPPLLQPTEIASTAQMQQMMLLFIVNLLCGAGVYAHGDARPRSSSPFPPQRLHPQLRAKVIHLRPHRRVIMQEAR